VCGFSAKECNGSNSQNKKPKIIEEKTGNEIEIMAGSGRSFM
jgi:hypothetical protein